jgi:hypothetical protein
VLKEDKVLKVLQVLPVQQDPPTLVCQVILDLRRLRVKEDLQDLPILDLQDHKDQKEQEVQLVIKDQRVLLSFL